MTGVDPVFASVVRLGLAALFATASTHKLRDPGAFAATLRDYRLLPAAVVPAAAVLVAAVEAATAVALVVPPFDPSGALAALLLLSAYSVAIGVNLARGRREIDCGCLGPGRGQRLGGWLLARNGLVALAAIVLLVPESPRTWLWPDLLSVAGGLFMLALLWDAAHRLGQTWAPSGRHS